MHQHEFRRARRERFESVAHRLLARLAADREGEAVDPVECGTRLLNLPFGGHDLDRDDLVCFCKHGGAAPEHGLPEKRLELLGDKTSCTLALSGGDDKRNGSSSHFRNASAQIATPFWSACGNGSSARRPETRCAPVSAAR